MKFVKTMLRNEAVVTERSVGHTAESICGAQNTLVELMNVFSALEIR